VKNEILRRSPTRVASAYSHTEYRKVVSYLSQIILSAMEMNVQTQLFPGRNRIEIPGLSYLSEFITTSEERVLSSHIEEGIWSHEFARRRQHYGMDYSKPNAGKREPLPPWIEMIARRIVAEGLFKRMPAHALVNEYLPGQGISAHKDYEPFEEVVSLSLASGCLMEFVELRTQTRQELWLEPRSLLVLVGEARHGWTHAIRPRLNDVLDGVKIPRHRRLSLTFRTLAATT
jgi:alkylated DNA repair dioxygenase AlkB